MKGIRYLTRRFIASSKVLSLSCIISICTATILILSMGNFALSINEAYSQSLRDEYGDFDMLITYDNYDDITNNVIKNIEEIRDIKQIALGRTSDRLIIQGNNIYALGVEDGSMMKSRYHYTSSLANDSIIINNVLADVIQCKVNDTIEISGFKIVVKEIINNSGVSNARVAMAIMNKEMLTKLTGESPNANFLMIKAKNNIDINQLSNKIFRVDSKLKPNIVEQDIYYKKSVESFTIYIIALSISVLLVASLFLVSIFKSFLYKYNMDMAIIRAIGGKSIQVLEIFAHIVITLCVFACSLAYIIALILNKVFFQNILYKFNFTSSKINFNYSFSIGLTLIIFSIIIIVLIISINRSTKILPIMAIKQNEIRNIGKIKRKKRLGLISFNNIFKYINTDLFIAIKMMTTKIKENLFIILTIVMIVIISFVGSSLSIIIKVNNTEFLQNQYLTDIVVTSSSLINYSDTEMIYDAIKKENELQVSLVLSNGEDMSLDNQSVAYQMADLKAMEKQEIIVNIIHDKNRMIISRELADKLDVKAGDYINVTTPGKYQYDENGLRIGFIEKPVQYQLGVSSILPKEKLNYRDVYIDIQLDIFRQDIMGMNYIYISGKLDVAEKVLQDIKLKYPSIVWSNYEEVVENSNQAINQRYAIFEIVTGALIIVAGLGWFNSIRNIVISRKREYSLLRIQGVSSKRLRKIIIIQIIIYLLIGIIGGVLAGTIILLLIMYREQKVIELIVNWRLTLEITIYLLFMSSLLLPLVNKICREKVLEEFERA